MGLVESDEDFFSSDPNNTTSRKRSDEVSPKCSTSRKGSDEVSPACETTTEERTINRSDFSHRKMGKKKKLFRTSAIETDHTFEDGEDEIEDVSIVEKVKKKPPRRRVRNISDSTDEEGVQEVI